MGTCHSSDFLCVPGGPLSCAAEQCTDSDTPVSCVHFSPWNDPFPALPPAQYDNVNGHSELLIERVSKEDSGTYVCSAENTVGSIKAIGFVYVKGT